MGYSDVGFTGNHDLSSQLGRIVLMMDDHNSAVPILYQSYKLRRVTRSVLAAEVIAFSDLFDDAFALRTHLEGLLDRPVPIHLLTDSKSLFDILTHGMQTFEKRLMLDIHAARQ